VRMALFATEDYIGVHGSPKQIEDVAEHRLICQSTASNQVGAGLNLIQHLLMYDVKSLLTVNNYFGVLQGVVNHLGIGVLPDYLTQDFPDLVRVLPDVESSEVPVFLAYPEELRQSQRVAAFKDFVQDEIITYRKQRKDA
jgi:DNA-binding transcriptional LysR family regulator